MSRLVLALLLSLFAGEVVAFQRACDNWQGLPFNEATMKGAHNAYELKYSVAELVRCPNTNAYDGFVFFLCLLSSVFVFVMSLCHLL